MTVNTLPFPLKPVIDQPEGASIPARVAEPSCQPENIHRETPCPVFTLGTVVKGS